MLNPTAHSLQNYGHEPLQASDVAWLQAECTGPWAYSTLLLLSYRPKAAQLRVRPTASGVTACRALAVLLSASSIDAAKCCPAAVRAHGPCHSRNFLRSIHRAKAAHMHTQSNGIGVTAYLALTL